MKQGGIKMLEAGGWIVFMLHGMDLSSVINADLLEQTIFLSTLNLSVDTCSAVTLMVQLICWHESAFDSHGIWT